jgi:hypothetical protein
MKLRNILISLILCTPIYSNANSFSYDTFNGLNVSLYKPFYYWDWQDEDIPESERTLEDGTSKFRFAGFELGQRYLLMQAGHGATHCCVGVETKGISIAVPYSGELPLVGYFHNLSALGFKMKLGAYTHIDKFGFKIQLGVGLGF